MLIRVASDLHLEGFAERDIDSLMVGFLPVDERDAISTLALAGDISSIPDQLIGFISRCVTRFKHVVFIPGNHSYYRHDYHAWNNTMNDRFADRVPTVIKSFGDVLVTEVDGVRFIIGTMWGDGGRSLADQAQVGFYLNDFRLIMNGQRRFSTNDMMDIARIHKTKIGAALKISFAGKTVVVTHHLPSRRLVSARFWPRDGSDGANGGFVNDCDTILAYDHAPDLWIHGHTHDSIDTMLWKTRIICNPAGYRSEWISPYNSFMTTQDTGGRITIPKFIEV